MESVSWQTVAVLVSLVGTFAVVIIMSVRTIVAGVNDSVATSIKLQTENFDKKFDELSAAMESNNVDHRKLEREFLEFKAVMPEKYVGRNDWIRYGGGIDAKVDYVGEKVHTLSIQVAHLSEQLNEGKM